MAVKFRGPGDVTFDNRARHREGRNEVTATATFSAPGEYILRAQVNDRSGEGGGGFQCCWTNVHVKVTISRRDDQVTAAVSFQFSVAS